MKKVCIKGNEFNTNYHLVYGEEKAIADGYSVFEVPQGKEDCCFEDFDNNGFNIEKYNERKEKEVNYWKFAQEKQELLHWFEYYDKQVMQYERCQRLGIEFDKDINELDEQASINQARLKEINELFEPKIIEDNKKV